ncbi:MAG: hypothetical protein V4664_02985 [Patescibacteria group bacterium]
MKLKKVLSATLALAALSILAQAKSDFDQSPWAEMKPGINVQLSNPLDEELPPEQDIYVPESVATPDQSDEVGGLWLLIFPEPVQVPVPNGSPIWARQPVDRRYDATNLLV